MNKTLVHASNTGFHTSSNTGSCIYTTRVHDNRTHNTKCYQICAINLPSCALPTLKRHKHGEDITKFQIPISFKSNGPIHSYACPNDVASRENKHKCEAREARVQETSEQPIVKNKHADIQKPAQDIRNDRKCKSSFELIL